MDYFLKRDISSSKKTVPQKLLIDVINFRRLYSGIELITSAEDGINFHWYGIKVYEKAYSISTSVIYPLSSFKPFKSKMPR